jgi:glycerophosphoryl diester phosphodiesterase
MRLYAHRGASSELPENTLPSFQRALALGADALETDVHMTRDGVLVAAHDPDGLRSADQRAEIRRATLAEVKRWDVGWGFVAPDGSRPFAGKGFEIPTLEELVVACPVRLNIDMKQQDPPIYRQVAELLGRLDACARVQVASFHARPLRAIRRLGYPGATSLAPAEVLALLTLPAAAFRRLCPGASLAQLPWELHGVRVARRGLIDRCRAAGLEVEFFTINDPVLAVELAALGPDGLMTDDPARIAPILGKRPPP